MLSKKEKTGGSFKVTLGIEILEEKLFFNDILKELWL